MAVFRVLIACAFVALIAVALAAPQPVPKPAPGPKPAPEPQPSPTPSLASPTPSAIASPTPTPTPTPDPTPTPMPSASSPTPVLAPSPSSNVTPSPSSNNSCVGNATCTGYNTYCFKYECVCVPNYYGGNCSTFCTRELNCSSKGSCSVDGTCTCDGMWQGSDCTSIWLLATTVSVMAALLLVSIIMMGCFIKNSCCDPAKSGYQPIQ